MILATPPGFRPQHLEYAVKAGKNVFCEKPVAVDGTGIRKVLAVAEEAKKKNLAVVAGTQRRHQAGYIEAMKRIKDGEIGDLVGGRVFWNQGNIWANARKPGWKTDMEYQLRNWYHFTWLCGQCIVEQHVHNLDVACWALGNPVSLRRHGRPRGQHRPRVRRELRPLRRRLRVPQRRPRPEHGPPDRRLRRARSPSTSSAPRGASTSRPAATGSRAATSAGSASATRSTPTSRSTSTCSRASPPASRSTSWSRSPRAA